MSSPDPFGDALEQKAQGDTNDHFGAALSARAAGAKFEKFANNDNPYDKQPTEGPQGFIYGLADLAGTGIANIPHAAAHGAVDLWRRWTGGDTNAPDPAIVQALEVKPELKTTGDVAESLRTALTQPIEGTGTPKPDAAAPLANSPVGQAFSRYVAPVVSDVSNIVPLVAPAVTAARGLTAGADALTAEQVAANTASRLSGGAAGTAVDLSNASPGLRQAVATVGAENGGVINQDVLKAHLEAEKNGVQLMKGAATQDPIQFSEEQNSTHPDIAARKNQNEQAMTDRFDQIRQEASPSHVANNARENGQVVIDDLKAYDEPIRANIKAKYQALQDANGGSIPIDTGSIIDNVDARLKSGSLTRTASKNDAISEVMDNLRSGHPMDFESYENARSLMAGIQRSARGTPESVAAGIVRDELEKMPLPPEAAPLKAMADDARSAAAARFEAMRRDPAYAAAVDDVTNGTPKGRQSPLADTFLDDYALSKSAPKVEVQALADKLSEDGKGALASHTLSTIRNKAIGSTGTVLPSGFNTSVAKLSDKLDTLIPQQTLDDLESLRGTVNMAKVPPAGHHVNPTKSGAIVNAALGLGQGAIQAKTMGMGVPIIKGMVERNFVKDALAPGAGLDYQR